jgi:DNA-binding CsgD family transcriptional regulator/tetratricopeptide (TPR) repeat protein
VPVGFVGRGAELARAVCLLGRVESGRAGGLLVWGQPGIGKTRLLAEVEELARARGLLTAHTVCLPLTTVLPFDPVLDLLRGLARAGHEDRAGPGPGTPAADVFAWAARGIEDAAARGALVLFIDDLHWSDRASLELIRYCMVRLADLSAGWVLAARPDGSLRAELADLAQRDGFGRVDLRGLSRAETAELARLAGLAVEGGPAVEELIEAVYARSGGNPFFATELFGALKDAGAGPVPGPAGAGDAAALLPATVADSVTGRLARLGGPPRALLSWMAVAPEPVTADLLARLLAGTGQPVPSMADLGAQLGQLAEADFVAVGQDGRWRFQHAIVRDAVYQLIPVPERAGMHAAVADALPSGAVAERAPQLAAAGRSDQAAGAYLELGEAALARGRGEDAGTLFARARQLAGAGGEVAWRARAGEVLALVRSARVAEAQQLAGPLFAEADGAVSTGVQLVGMARYALALTDASELEAARNVASQLAALEPGDDHRATAEAALARAFVLTMAGEPAAALPLARQAVAAARASGDPVLVLRASNRLGLAAGLATSSSAGRDVLARVAIEAQDRGLPAEAGLAWLNLSFFADLDGDAAAMEAAAGCGLQAGDLPPVTGVLLRANLGVARMLQGDLDGALAHTLAAVAAAAPLGPATSDRAAVALAHVHIRRGELTAARRLLGQLQPAASGSFEHRRSLEPQAMLLEEEGDLAAARAAYREAARDDGHPAAAWCLAGLARDAAAALAAARRLEAMGARRAADRARAAARSLGARPGRPHRHHGPLTEREFEVALLVAAGQTNADIASTLYLSPRTVERHIGNILAKLGFRSRAQIAAHVATGNLPGTPSPTRPPPAAA